jgi:hypothetical protein
VNVAERLELERRFARLTVGEPPVRDDGRCCMCNRMRRPEQSRTYAGGCAEMDPFCSSTCARRFHGTSLPTKRAGTPRERVA